MSFSLILVHLYYIRNITHKIENPTNSLNFSNISFKRYRISISFLKISFLLTQTIKFVF